MNIDTRHLRLTVVLLFWSKLDLEERPILFVNTEWINQVFLERLNRR